MACPRCHRLMMELLYRDFKREDFEIFARSTVPQRITVTRPSAS